MENSGQFTLLESVFNGTPFQIDLGGESTAWGALTIIANIVIILAIGVSFIYMAYSFVSIAGSWGDEKLLKKSSDSLLWSIGAFIISVLAFAIVTVIRNLIGV